MALCPFATKRLLPENRTEPFINATQIVSHSIVGSAEAAYGWFLNGSDLESHFIIRKNGEILQLIDTARQADAQSTANARAISIETEDNGKPDSDPWTPAQIKSLIRLHEWLFKTHPKIMRRICPKHDEPGIGFHTMFGAPGPWTPVRKTCPGKIRVTQWRREILPALLGPRDLGVGDLGDDVRDWQANLVKVGYDIGEYGADGVFGTDTERATRAFQEAWGLYADGIVGRDTLTAMGKALQAASVPVKPAVPEHDWQVTVRWRHAADEGAARVLGTAHGFRVEHADSPARDLKRACVGYDDPNVDPLCRVVGPDRVETARLVARLVRDSQWGADLRLAGRKAAGL